MYQMRLDFESFYIEPIEIQDAWNICDFICTNEDRLKPYFKSTLEQNLTPDLSKFFVEKKVKQFQSKEEFLFTLKTKAFKEIIGLIYLKELDWNKKKGEFAYCIGYAFEGKGIISKAIDALSTHFFKEFGIKTLEIIVHKANIRSVKVAKNCNFIWKKTLINEFAPTGKKLINMELYQLHSETSKNG